MRSSLILTIAIILSCSAALFLIRKTEPLQNSGNMVLPTLFPEKPGTESPEALGAMLYESSAGTLSETELNEVAERLARKRSGSDEWTRHLIRGYYRQADHPRRVAATANGLKR